MLDIRTHSFVKNNTISANIKSNGSNIFNFILPLLKSINRIFKITHYLNNI